MKNLESARLKRYRVDPPIETAAGFGTFFPGSKVYAFEFPNGEDAILKSTISVLSVLGMESTRISVVVLDSKKQTVDTAGEEEVYELQEYLQSQGEKLVWQYNQQMHAMRVNGIKSIKGVDFDLQHSPVHVMQYNDELPPLKHAYESKMRKSGEYTYARGKVGSWQFVHLQADSKFPWETLQKIADKVFKNDLVQVFFNEETKKHPGEFVLWYHPLALPII